jgi:hypothetical protein
MREMEDKNPSYLRAIRHCPESGTSFVVSRKRKEKNNVSSLHLSDGGYGRRRDFNGRSDRTRREEIDS